MKPDWQNESADDELDRRMKALRSPDTPDDLLPRCLKTIVPADEGTVVRREMLYQSDKMCPGTRSLDKMSWIMRRPIFRAAATVIFVLAIGGVALWFHTAGTQFAFADFARPIIEAKTAKYKLTFATEDRPPMTFEAMELIPYRRRWESRHDVAGKSEIRDVTVYDYQKGKQLVFRPEEKSATITSFADMPKEWRTKDWFAEVRSLLLDARDKPEVKREPPGEKEIDGHNVIGYRVTCNRGLDDGMVMTLWGDPKTGLPVRVERIVRSSGKVDTLTMSDFAFDVALDESLFSTEPPAGYTTMSLRWDFPPAGEKELIETLRLYSQQLGGRFPDVLDLPAAQRFAVSFQSKTHKLTNEEMQKKMQDAIDAHTRLTCGLRFVSELPLEADVRYAGTGVSLGKTGTPIFWYRPKDAKNYRVIYADLSVRDADTPPNVPKVQPAHRPVQPEKIVHRRQEESPTVSVILEKNAGANQVFGGGGLGRG